MISCWHNADGTPFRQTDLNLNVVNAVTVRDCDMTVPNWLAYCELTETVFDYTANSEIFPPCVNFFGQPHLDRVAVLGVRLESAEGIFSNRHFIDRSLSNISQQFSGTPRGIDNMLPVAWIGYESYDHKIYVNNNQLSGHLRGLLTRRQAKDIHTLLLDFVVMNHDSVRVAHHTSIQRWIAKHGRAGQRYMQFPYTSRVMQGWLKIEEHDWTWWIKPRT